MENVEDEDVPASSSDLDVVTSSQRDVTSVRTPLSSSYEIASKHSSAGDPHGRRLARRRAGLLSEAERIARTLEILLERASYDSSPVKGLAQKLREQQEIDLQKAHGRLEPRSRFKSPGSHPLLLRRPPFNLYVDESGTSVEHKAGGIPSFALGAIAISDAEAEKYVAAADQIKMTFFERSDFQFHEPFMRKRFKDSKQKADYWFDGDRDKHLAFDHAIQRLIQETEFVSFGVGIRKDGFRDTFVLGGFDPYLPMDVYCVAITLLLERFVDALAHRWPESIGRVRVESQGPREDAYHQMEFARLLLEGSQWVPESAFQAWLEPGMTFSPKGTSDPSELADIFARDLFEWIQGDCDCEPKWWSEFSSKAYVRGDGRMGKFGIKIFPDADFRHRVETHRKQYGASLVL